ncbi:MAG: hypothetical protein ACRCSG_08165 [Cellulosilyticaceae bacterium]
MEDERGINKNKTQMLIFIAIGVVALGIILTYIPKADNTVIATFATEETEEAVQKQALTYEEKLEVRLETILATLEGAGNTKVMVTTSTTNEMILAEEVVESVQDTDESDNSGRTKSNKKQDVERKIVMQKGDTPFVIKENKPQIEGVIVFAEGADDIIVKDAIMKSVSSVLNVPVHKIAVFKMATK